MQNVKCSPTQDARTKMVQRFHAPPFSFGILHLAFCMGLLGLASCSKSQPRADLVFIQSAEPETIDPALVTDQVSMRISEALFEGLCRYDDNGQPQPGVAERWEVSADKKH
jgi:oligopeptide transport system substrate-binding protein